MVTLLVHELLEATMRVFSTKPFMTLAEVRKGLTDPDNSGIFSAETVEKFWKLNFGEHQVQFCEMTEDLFVSIDVTYKMELFRHGKSYPGFFSRTDDYLKHYKEYGGKVLKQLIPLSQRKNAKLPHI